MENKTACSAALLLSLLLPAAGVAQESAEPTPLERGFYAAPMGTYFKPDTDRDLDDGAGYNLSLGYRFGGIAVELAGQLIEADPSAPTTAVEAAELTGGNLSALLFLGDEKARVFGILGLGYQEADKHPNLSQKTDGLHLDLGVGYLYPLNIGRYDFGIRAEVRSRIVSLDRAPADSLTGTGTMVDGVASLGFQLPFGLRRATVVEPVESVQVVSAGPACSDGQDNDFDGLTDFPADPGCKSPEDDDETTAQCSDGIDNDNDGQIDLADTGCRDGDDNDELNACKAPGPGEIIDLSGCGAGDEIVLRGVHFEFDEARLTSNAESILDDVVAALVKFQSMKIELGGHTDSFGSDSYNQKLSERRAESVKTYLINGGVAEERITAIGFGESQPAASNETSEGRDENRRVTLKVIGE